MKYNYCIKHEDVHEKCTIFDYENVFTDEHLSFIRDDYNNPFDESSFEIAKNIRCSGDYAVNFISHIYALMTSKTDGTQFTHLQIYLTVDGVVDCNITLSTSCTSLGDILNFVHILSVNVDISRRNELTFYFTRPDFDTVEFTLESTI